MGCDTVSYALSSLLPNAHFPNQPLGRQFRQFYRVGDE